MAAQPTNRETILSKYLLSSAHPQHEARTIKRQTSRQSNKTEKQKTRKREFNKANEEERRRIATEKTEKLFYCFCDFSCRKYNISSRLFVFVAFCGPNCLLQSITNENDSMRALNFNAFHSICRKCPFDIRKLIHLWLDCSIYSFRGDASVMYALTSRRFRLNFTLKTVPSQAFWNSSNRHRPEPQFGFQPTYAWIKYKINYLSEVDGSKVIFQKSKKSKLVEKVLSATIVAASSP